MSFFIKGSNEVYDRVPNITFDTLKSAVGSDVKKIEEKADQVGVTDTAFFELFSQVPGYSEALFDALYRSHVNGNVDHKLKEIIRIRLARQAGDTYFSNLRSRIANEQGLTEEQIESGCGDFEKCDKFTQQEKWALNYSKLMYTEPSKVNQEFYKLGKNHFSEAQIMELGSFIAFHYGIQSFMRTLKVYPMKDKKGNIMTQDQSRIYYQK